MTYKPPSKTGGEIIRGQASVRVNGARTKAKIVFRDKGEYIISIDECDEAIRKYIVPGDFIVALNGNGDKLYSLYPANGLFEVTTKRFVAQEGELPSPRTKIGSDGKKTWEYLYFIAILEIVSGDFQGNEIPLFLRYNFAEIGEEGHKVVGYSKRPDKSRHTAILDEYLTIAGAWEDGAIPYTDNCLPILEKRILKAGKRFRIVIKNGYVETFYTNELPYSTEEY